VYKLDVGDERKAALMQGQEWHHVSYEYCSAGTCGLGRRACMPLNLEAVGTY
jgi:hypothetical protein